MNLRDQVAIVTGGGSGMGRAIAISLSTRGVHCALVGRRPAVLEAAVAALETSGMSIAADLTDHRTHDRIIEETQNALGPVDILVHAAGTLEKQPIESTTDEFWNEIMAVNLTAVMALTRTAWPSLSASAGQIVMVSSAASTEPFAGNAAYAAAKAGVDALGRVLALEGKDHGIRVLTLNPAQTDTPLWQDKAPPEVRARMMDPGAVGELAASLIAADRGIDISEVRIRPTRDPWKQAE